MAITRISFRLLLAAMIPAAVRAADAQSPIPDSLATTLARVRPTEVLRLSVAGDRIAGVFERLPDGGSLRHVTSDRFISITSIDSIWHRRSNVRAGSRNGVKMGALAG
ncbi:MAG TPA: hypothetical protein VFO55_00180, partial [Gemmatimonadaceae bacterium]|nr:hypothetical protein [Gemmatimonadaceae bacterium]